MPSVPEMAHTGEDHGESSGIRGGDPANPRITDPIIREEKVGGNRTEIYILCAKGACSNWKWSGVSITGGVKSSKCSNIPSPAAC